MSNDALWNQSATMQGDEDDLEAGYWLNLLNQPASGHFTGYEGGFTFTSPIQAPSQTIEPRMLTELPLLPTAGSCYDDQTLPLTLGQTHLNAEDTSLEPVTLTSTTLSTPAPKDTNTTVSESLPPRYLCPQDGCEKTFESHEYLRWHIQRVHGNRSRYLCHFRRCPRGIRGHGFNRKDKLVDHLQRRDHDLSREEAVYQAALHNGRHGRSQ